MVKSVLRVAKDPTLRTICLLLFLYGTLFSAIGPYQALIAITVFDLPDAAWSGVMFASALVTVAASVGFGIITDQHNNRRTMAVFCASLTCLGGFLVWAFASTPAFLLVHLLIWPMGASIFGQLFALARLAAARFGPGEPDMIMAAVRAIFALAFVIALPFWSLAFANGVALTALYPTVMTLAAIVILTILFAWPNEASQVLTSQQSGLSFLASLREVLTRHIVIRVALLALISAANVLFMSLLGLLFQSAPGREFRDAAVFLTLVTALEVPFMLTIGAVSSRFGRVRLIAGGGFFYGLFLAVFVTSISAWWVWAMAIPAALGAALILSVPISYLQDLLSHRPGAGGSLLAVNQVAGAACAAGIFAFGTWVGDYVTVALIGSVAAMLAAIALGAIEKSAGNWHR